MSASGVGGAALVALFIATCTAVHGKNDSSDGGQLNWKKPSIARSEKSAESSRVDRQPLRSDNDNKSASFQMDAKQQLESKENSKRADTKDNDNKQKTSSLKTAPENEKPFDQAPDEVQQATHEVPLSGFELIKQAYHESQQANSEDQYSAIIALCEQGLRGEVSGEATRYAHRLMSWAHNRRGKYLADTGDDEAALADFETAVELDKTRWRAYHNRGVSYAMEGRHQEAVADFTHTIRLNPRHANAYFNRGELLYEAGKYEQALRDYDRAIQLAPDDAPAYNNRGHAYYRLGKYKHAVRDFTEAIRLDTQFAAAYANRGQLYSDLGYYDYALRDFQRAVNNDPELGRAYLGAAWILATCPDRKFRDPEQAVAAASRAIEIDGDGDPRYLDTLAAAHASSGQFGMAQQALAAAIQRAPEDQARALQRRLEIYRSERSYVSRPKRLSTATAKNNPRGRIAR